MMEQQTARQYNLSTNKEAEAQESCSVIFHLSFRILNSISEVPIGLMRSPLVGAENKNTAGILSAVLSNNYSIQNYRGVVTVTEADFAPRVLLTTAATA